MLVTFVSQCQKNALKRTRRILDTFANRIGDNVWQTPITEEGLETVRRLLKASATKSTAVSCHRIRTRKHTQLVWVVGNRRQFDAQGWVAVNRTKRSILHNEWENNWQRLNAMTLVSTLAALLHDIGKSNNGFQRKLFHPNKAGDPYRHEWLSLKLWLWLIKDCQTDQDVWQRLQTIDEFLASQQPTANILQTIIEPNPVEKSQIEKSDFDHLPPVAQWIAWLIVTHHRLPPLETYFFKAKQKDEYLKVDNRYFKRHLTSYYQKYLKAYDYWVKNPASFEIMTQEQLSEFFCFNELVLYSPDWQKQLKRYAKKAEQDVILGQLSKLASQTNTAIADPFLLMLSRLSLMVGDHNYSALKKEDTARRVKGSQDWQNKLIANTDRKTGQANQSLDEHLLGVARFTAQFCRRLPILHQQLPRLSNHEPLEKNTANQRFAWQNHAFKLARSQSELAQTHGFFGVNMTSTGGGKTIGNARIMYALANPKTGVRLSIALGLRVLTLQTGQSFRQNLQLDDRQLAVLVGGHAHKQLFELKTESVNDDSNNLFAQFGSESAQNLVDDWVDGDDYDEVLEELNLGTVIKDNTSRQLLASPIVVCTIDHLMQASECQRGGKYIAPMLRLFSGDLIIDEPDDFDQNDLPALSRLIHLAGLFGSKVLLSSATLPPDMVAGLYQAYLAGRVIYNQQFGYASPKVVCAWFDENHCHSESLDNASDFTAWHKKFTTKRTQFLAKLPPRRMAQILPLSPTYNSENQAQFYQALAWQLLNYAHSFHQQHHLSANGKKVSVGLIRMANIQPLMQLAQAIHQLCPPLANLSANLPTKPPAGTIDPTAIPLTSFDDSDSHFYLCCYHSQQVLALRNRLENRLDALLNRQNASDQDIIERADIAHAIGKNPHKTHHIFIVLATAVAEVGRDHDYDWAIVEPSSMRSIIQLAGRVWRHRPDKIASCANIGIWQYNIQALKSQHTNPNASQVVFSRPGFESQQHKLDSHDMNDLIPQSTLQKLDATSRIEQSANPKPTTNLADLEHHVMADLMNNPRFNVVNAYFKDTHTANRNHTHLISLTPFRSGRANVSYIIKPNGFKPNDDTFNIYNADSVKHYGLSGSNTENSVIEPYVVATTSPFVSVWLDSHLQQVLIELEHRFVELSPNSVVIRFSNIALATQQNNKTQQSYYFDERFGCWKKSN